MTSNDPTDPTARLRQAAGVVREAAAALNGKRWTADHHPEGTVVRPADSTRSLFQLHADGRSPSGTPCVSPAMGTWIALMGPVVGGALARWLETEAASNAGDEDHEDCTAETCATVAALALADAILAGVSP